MRILAIDPGNIESAYALIEMPEFRLIEFAKLENEILLEKISKIPFGNVGDFVIEMVGCYGMPVGKDVFETCVWIGEFQHALKLQGYTTNYIYRKQEAIALCNSVTAKDSNIKQALINRYAKHNFKNGKGTKTHPDTFYGVANDVWQAIAVGVTHYDINYLN